MDFETFSTVRDTVDPALEGNTCADPFTITSTSQGTSGQICGENAGQHIYWDLGRESTATATIRYEVVSYFEGLNPTQEKFKKKNFFSHIF